MAEIVAKRHGAHTDIAVQQIFQQQSKHQRVRMGNTQGREGP